MFMLLTLPLLLTSEVGHVDCQDPETGRITRLVGIGATFPSAVYEAWMPVYQYEREDFVQLDKDYWEKGSLDGKTAIMEDPKGDAYEYGASDAVMTQQDRLDYPDLVAVPSTAGAVVLAYYLPMLTTQLVLSREAIVAIYNGTITKWDDPILQNLNPGVPLPPNDIRVVARADFSGTTEIFTSALSAFDPAWNETFGTFADGLDHNTDLPIKWNASVVQYYGRTNRGMVGLIFSYRFAIGYMTVCEVVQGGWTYAKLVNQAGHVVDVNVTEMRRMVAAVPDEQLQPGVTGQLVNSPLEYAYPIIGFSYILLRRSNMSDCEAAVELFRYVEFLLYNNFAQEICEEFGFVQIPAALAGRIEREVLDQMMCGDPLQSVLDLVNKQKEEERKQSQLWRIPVFIAIPLLVLALTGIVAVLILQQIKLRKALLSDEWCIPVEDIQLTWDRDRGRLMPNGINTLSIMNASRTLDFISGTTHMSGMSDVTHVWGGNMAMLGVWKGKRVCLRKFSHETFYISKRSAKLTALGLQMKIIHQNVLRFYGVTFSPQSNLTYIVSEHTSKGSLRDVLQNSKYRLDDNFKYSMAIDVAHGMDFLHSQMLVHGNLSSDCCMIDNRWNVKVSDWEFHKLYIAQESNAKNMVHPVKEHLSATEDLNQKARQCFWTAPELLRSPYSLEPNKKTDVYSFGILLVEIFTREDPFSDLTDTMDPVAVLQTIMGKSVRPSIHGVQPAAVIPIMTSAWEEQPSRRPDFNKILKLLIKAKPTKKSVIESMMETLEGYVLHLEDKVAERTAELAAVNQNLQDLLHEILPPSVARKLSNGENVAPEQYDSVTIYFSDIVGFTNLCAKSTPMQVVQLLNDLYTLFDEIIGSFDIYKVETIGDAYMVISGLPIRNGSLHAAHVARAALKLMVAASAFTIKSHPDEKLKLRAGIHSGPVVAGVVGVKMPRYCLFGDTVNTASRMESTSIAQHIQVSSVTQVLLEELQGFTLELRGQMEVKGKGSMTTYFLKDAAVS